jgi:Sigma-70, region 4
MDAKQDPNAAQPANLDRSEVPPPVGARGEGDRGAAPYDAPPRTEGALALDMEAPAPVTREQRRSRRKRAIRARTISVKRMTKRELELGRMLYPEVEEIEHPRTRADCVGGERPCPFVSCKHHLYLDVSARTGAIKLNFPDLEVWEMTETCALDVADRGGTTLEEVGAIMNLTRERIRQVEVKGLAKLAALRDMSTLRDYVEEGPTGKRRLPVLDAAHEEDELDGDEDREDVEVEAEPQVAGEVNVDAFTVDLD